MFPVEERTVKVKMIQVILPMTIRILNLSLIAMTMVCKMEICVGYAE